LVKEESVISTAAPTVSLRHNKVVLAYIEEPPFGFTIEGGIVVGSDIELAHEVLKAIGVRTIEYRLTTFAELLPGAASENWDINVPLFLTRARAEYVDFSVPVWALRDGFLVKGGNPKRLTSYEAVATEEHARLGVITGQVQHDAAKRAGIPPARIEQFATQHEALAVLAAGRIDAYASTALGNRTLAARVEHAGLSAVSLESSPTRDDAIPRGAFSFSQANRGLREAFDAQLRVYLGSHDHRRRMARYGFTDAEIDPVVQG
jgi:polar amino acid transport system substrate-binding protein